MLAGFYTSNACPEFSESLWIDKWRKCPSIIEATSLNAKAVVISSLNEDINLKSLLSRTGLSCIKKKKNQMTISWGTTEIGHRK